MSDIEKDYYADIFVTGDSLDRPLLASLVSPYIRIYMDGDQYEITFTSAGQNLTVRHKLLIYLLTKKVLWDGGKIEMEGVPPSEIEEETGIPGGSIRPNLGKLVDARLVQNNQEKGGYYVPNYALEKIKEELQHGD